MRFFPKTYLARQGTRKKDRWGPCRECGYPGAFRCFRCLSWRCRDDVKLRAVSGTPGLYRLVCFPHCRKRLSPGAAAVVAKATRRQPAEPDLDE